MTYADLFAAIGTAHGYGDNVAVTGTFNLPDYRGRFIRGVDGAVARDPNRATRTAAATGGNTGDNVGSVQLENMTSHNHQVYSFTGGSAGQAVSLSGLSGARAFYYNSAGTALDFPSGFFVQNNHFTNLVSTGTGETRPLNAYVNYIIKI